MKLIIKKNIVFCICMILMIGSMVTINRLLGKDTFDTFFRLLGCGTYGVIWGIIDTKICKKIEQEESECS